MTLSNEDLRKAQLLMLKILKEVHRICEENDIKYFLSDGTLLGAIRHNGFIPWDDDLDIGMVRSEYNKFCKIAADNLGDDFLIQNYSTDKGYALPFSKIILKDTLWIEKSAEKTERQYSGIYIDIFPYDKIPVDKKKQNKHKKVYSFVNGLLYIKLKYNLIQNVHGVARKVYFIIKAIISSFYSVDKLIMKRNNLCVKFEKMQDDYILTKYGGNFYRNQNPFEAFYYTELHSFEDDVFYIPRQYDSIMKNLYGDYMQLPPKDQRVNHGIEYYDFGKYKDI